jgi:hypothetical protein
MSSLFALTDQYRSLQALAESESDIPEEVLQDTLEGLGGELQIKAQNVARFVLNQDAMAEAIENASAAMKVRAERLRKRNASLKSYLLMCMEGAGISRIESPEIVVAIKKNPASVVVFDESAIPPNLMTQKPAPPPAPDKTAIKELLKAGTDVPGCRLEQGQRLDVRA